MHIVLLKFGSLINECVVSALGDSVQTAYSVSFLSRKQKTFWIPEKSIILSLSGFLRSEATPSRGVKLLDDVFESKRSLQTDELFCTNGLVVRPQAFDFENLVHVSSFIGRTVYFFCGKNSTNVTTVLYN